MSDAVRPRNELYDPYAMYEFVKQFFSEHKYPPSRTEIAEHFGCADHTVRRKLEVLENDGLISSPPQAKRAIVIHSAQINFTD